MDPVKDQLTLVRAFLRLVAADRGSASQRFRLVIIGDGMLRSDALRMLREAGADHFAWLPGDREDIPEIMRGLDIFVLPSLAEGISNTILEAMASGLPIVATRVGGNPELVDEGKTGALVPPNDPAALAEAISRYLEGPGMMTAHGRAGREKVEGLFSMEAMVEGYLAVYDEVLRGKQCAA
jgi:glycosyltransferase involved in cell wall biosynthesis